MQNSVYSSRVARARNPGGDEDDNHGGDEESSLRMTIQLQSVPSFR